MSALGDEEDVDQPHTAPASIELDGEQTILKKNKSPIIHHQLRFHRLLPIKRAKSALAKMRKTNFNEERVGSVAHEIVFVGK